MGRFYLIATTITKDIVCHYDNFAQERSGWAQLFTLGFLGPDTFRITAKMSWVIPILNKNCCGLSNFCFSPDQIPLLCSMAWIPDGKIAFWNQVCIEIIARSSQPWWAAVISSSGPVFVSLGPFLVVMLLFVFSNCCIMTFSIILHKISISAVFHAFILIILASLNSIKDRDSW